MSMEHKAYVFDTVTFKKELQEILSNGNNNILPIKNFIDQHIGQIKSPYDEEYIDEEWEEQLETKDIQEYCDFALAYYYDIEENLGLEYYWELILDVLKMLELRYPPEYYILGDVIKMGDTVLDPGYCGLGIVDAVDIKSILDELGAKKVEFINKVEILDKERFDDITEQELLDCYDELYELYLKANEDNKGIMMTF